MSAIDTIDHAHAEFFFGIPVYWFLENAKMNKITDRDIDSEKIVSKFYISVGGGSGEHRALILNNDALIFNLIKSFEEINKSDDINYKIYELSEDILDKYSTNDKEDIYHWRFDQNHWPLSTFIRIHDEMNKINPNKQDLQQRIQNALALFIIYKMPLKHCLKDPDLIEIASLLKANPNCILLKESKENFIGFTGTNLINGRITINNSTVFGYSLDDWKRENNSYELSEKLNADLTTKNKINKVKI